MRFVFRDAKEAERFYYFVAKRIERPVLMVKREEDSPKHVSLVFA